MIDALKKLFVISRPVSWPNTAFPFAAGYLVMAHSIDWLWVLGTVFFLIPYNLLMYGVNDVYDYESDIRNPRKGGIEGAKTQKAFHSTILWSAYVSSGLFLVPLFILSNSVARTTLLIIIFFVLAYSLPRLRFKERPLLDSVTSSIHFVGPLVYALTLTSFPTAAWPLVVSFFLWGVASHAFGAVQDILPDRQGGLASIATVFGARTTTRFSIVLYAISGLLMLIYGLPTSLLAIVAALYIINILPYVSIDDARSESSNAAWRRFIYLNLFAGFAVTMILIVTFYL